MVKKQSEIEGTECPCEKTRTSDAGNEEKLSTTQIEQRSEDESGSAEGDEASECSRDGDRGCT